MSSTPMLEEFTPNAIPFQRRVLQDIRLKFEYDKGVQEILLSGSVGSAKSLLCAHIAVTHCLLYPKSRVLIGRRTLRELKRTLLNVITQHLEGFPYKHNKSEGIITFPNGSEIITHSWDDGNYKKVRSYELSMAIIEELTENDSGEFYEEIKMRVGRLPHVKENVIIAPTNPDAPSHWAYEYFVVKKHPNRHVYYSLTEQNPYLPESYVQNLKETLDPKQARRMLYGEWIEITKDVIYHSYNRDYNFANTVHNIHPGYPIYVGFDFNIGEGKPLSGCFAQYINDRFYFYEEFIIEGARTQDALDDIASRGLLDERNMYILTGDATGAARSTKSIHSDWEIIEKFFSNYRNKHGYLRWQSAVPRSNPPVRERHNKVNSYMENALGQHRLTVYAPCKTLDKGFRLTALKKGGSYIEDDSKEYQHVTTAAGYLICAASHNVQQKKAFTVAR